MTTNLITLLPKEYSTSTTLSVYPGFTSSVRETSSDVTLVKVAFVVPAKPARSRRNGRKPLHVEQHEMEKASPSRRARMEIARATLGAELGAQLPDSLAKLRLSRGMSQMQLAEAIGTSQPHIAKIEAGALQLFWSTATKIADALAVSLDELRPLVKVAKAETAAKKPIVRGL